MGTEVFAVLTAAGMGTRLGADSPKGLVELAGRPLVLRAYEGLAAVVPPANICVTAPEQFVSRFQELFPQALVVAGSAASRQESVLRGLNRLDQERNPGENAVVLVHDAARCLTPPAMIARVAAAVDAAHPAVIPGLPLTDTVKEVLVSEPSSPSTDGAAPELILSTPPRTALRIIQTPQAFLFEPLLGAHRTLAHLGQSEGTAATDDAAIMEQSGFPAFVVEGDALAMKVTRPEDLQMARTLLHR